MAKSRRVTFELPPASHRVLEQVAEENGINVQAAASLILQAALARRVSGLVPKRRQPAKGRSDGGQATDPVTLPSPGPSQGSEGV